MKKKAFVRFITVMNTVTSYDWPFETGMLTAS